jgi:2'-5' RNA ligase
MSGSRLTDHGTWRPDWTAERRNSWWYAAFGSDPTVRQLARVAQAAIRPDAPVDRIPSRWLHLSLAEVGYAADVPPAAARECARAAQLALSPTRPVTLSVGPVSIMPGAVVLAVRSPELVELHDQLVASMALSLSRPPAQRPFMPHISVAYVRLDCAIEDIFDRPALEGGPGQVLAQGSVSTELTEIALVEVARDRRYYRWTPRHRLGLG